MEIPKLDREKEKYWSQPSRSEIIIRNKEAYMTMDIFEGITYSASNPIGKAPGKIWRNSNSQNSRRLSWYDMDLGIYTIPINIIDDEEEFERFKREIMAGESIKNTEKLMKEKRETADTFAIPSFTVEDTEKMMEDKRAKNNEKLMEALEVMKENPDIKYVEADKRGFFEKKSEQIGKLVERKDQAYGSATRVVAKFLLLLFPNGIEPYQYEDLGLIVRSFDKLKRVANKSEDNKDEFEESPWQDVAGYGIIGAVKDDKSF